MPGAPAEPGRVPGTNGETPPIAPNAAQIAQRTALATRLQKEGAEAFVKSWNSLMQRIAQQSGAQGAPRQKTG